MLCGSGTPLTLAGLLACVPAITLANVNFVPQNTTAAPELVLQQRY
jgi:hypothetical protein